MYEKLNWFRCVCVKRSVVWQGCQGVLEDWCYGMEWKVLVEDGKEREDVVGKSGRGFWFAVGVELS